MKRRLLGKKYAFNNIKANEFLLSTQQTSNLTQHKSNCVNQKYYFDPFSYRDHVTFRKYSFHKLKQSSSLSKLKKKNDETIDQTQQMIDLIQHLQLWKQIKTNRNQILVKSNKNGQPIQKLQKYDDQTFFRHKKLNQLKSVAKKQIYHLNKMYLREYLANKKQFSQQYSQLNAKSPIKVQLNNIKKLIKTVQKEQEIQNHLNGKQMKKILNKKCVTQSNQQDKNQQKKAKKNKLKLKTEENQQCKSKIVISQKHNSKFIDKQPSQKIKLVRKPMSLLNFKKQTKSNNQLQQIQEYFIKQSKRIQNQIVSKYRRDVNYKLSSRQHNTNNKPQEIISQTVNLRKTQI